MLPTQASGRWSTTNPPLVNFPAHAREECDRCKDLPEEEWCPRNVREVVLPAPGTYWLHFDLDGIEGRFCSAYSRDDEELEGYRKKWDLHTLNACDMWKHERPPVYTKALHTAPEAEAWRQSWNPPWSGAADRRRHTAKTMKYATQFGKDAKAALNAKGIDKLGLSKKLILTFAGLYLAAKTILTAYKRKKFEEYARTNESRTFRGRRRRLFGDAWTRAKEGFSHQIAGSLPDIMNDYIIQFARDPLLGKGWLVLNAHDGLTWAMPGTNPNHPLIESPPSINSVVKRAKEIVERDWDVEGVKMPVSADWELVFPDGTKRRV